MAQVVHACRDCGAEETHNGAERSSTSTGAIGLSTAHQEVRHGMYDIPLRT